MKKLLVILVSIMLLSSCTVSYRGTAYGRINRTCPTVNTQAFFYQQGTGKSFLPKYVFKKN